MPNARVAPVTGFLEEDIMNLLVPPVSRFGVWAMRRSSWWEREQAA